MDRTIFDIVLYKVIKPKCIRMKIHETFLFQEDLMKAVRKVGDNKKLESKLDYKPI